MTDNVTGGHGTGPLGVQDAPLWSRDCNRPEIPVVIRDVGTNRHLDGIE